ncbi:MAG: helix-turn-helix transcriptional regulator [Eubacterium sp.]|nr:helix-turn-helix transcriptional regulator [Eubacterium sp.]
MSQTGYNQYEIGKNDIPTRVLIKLADFYNTSIDYMLGTTDEKKSYPRTKKPKLNDSASVFSIFRDLFTLLGNLYNE